MTEISGKRLCFTAEAAEKRRARLTLDPLRSSASSAVICTNMNINDISAQILDASIIIHKRLGPGLLESAYGACLAYELRKRGLKALTQVALPVVYDDVQLDVGYRLDVLVEDSVIVELKALEHVLPLHEAQLITYLKLSDKRLGLLINFNVLRLKDGFRRFANNL